MTPLLVECKRRSEPRLLREMAARFELARIKQPEAYQVLIAAYLSPESTAICQEHGVGYMNLAGNCHLSFGQIHIHREGIANPFRESRGAAALAPPRQSECCGRCSTRNSLGDNGRSGILLNTPHRGSALAKCIKS